LYNLDDDESNNILRKLIEGPWPDLEEEQKAYESIMEDRKHSNIMKRDLFDLGLNSSEDKDNERLVISDDDSPISVLLSENPVSVIPQEEEQKTTAKSTKAKDKAPTFSLGTKATVAHPYTKSTPPKIEE
jgi:hypothetical protein